VYERSLSDLRERRHAAEQAERPARGRTTTSIKGLTAPTQTLGRTHLLHYE
jgi:hypothetical protein